MSRPLGGVVRDVLVKVEVVDVSESLANVTETTLCNVSEGEATISDAATILILAIKTDVQEPTLSLGVEVPPRYWDLHQYARSLSGLLVSHLVLARMLPPTSLPALCHVVTMGKACCTTFCKQLLNVSVPVGRAQDSYKFCKNLC